MQMKYVLIISEPSKKEIRKPIECNISDARKLFTNIKQKYKHTGTLLAMYKFKDGKWIGFLRN
jgi:hypothetical protein